MPDTSPGGEHDERAAARRRASAALSRSRAPDALAELDKRRREANRRHLTQLRGAPKILLVGWFVLAAVLGAGLIAAASGRATTAVVLLLAVVSLTIGGLVAAVAAERARSRSRR